jgi:hypothetical protein
VECTHTVPCQWGRLTVCCAFAMQSIVAKRRFAAPCRVVFVRFSGSTELNSNARFLRRVASPLVRCVKRGTNSCIVFSLLHTWMMASLSAQLSFSLSQHTQKLLISSRTSVRFGKSRSPSPATRIVDRRKQKGIAKSLGSLSHRAMC